MKVTQLSFTLITRNSSNDEPTSDLLNLEGAGVFPKIRQSKVNEFKACTANKSLHMVPMSYTGCFTARDRNY